MPRTWQKVEEMFDGSYRYETSKLKLILDGLMNAGMPQYLSVLEYSYSRNIALVVSITVKVLNFRTLHREIYPNCAKRMANSADPDQTAPLGAV